MASQADPAEGTGSGVRAQHFFVGYKINRTTLNKIERIMRVFNCLNENYYGGKLAVATYVSTRRP